MALLDEDDRRRAEKAGLEWPPGVRYPPPPLPGREPPDPGPAPQITLVPTATLKPVSEGLEEIQQMLEDAPYCVSEPRERLGEEHGAPVGTFVETPPLKLGRESAAEGQTEGYIEQYDPNSGEYLVVYREGGRTMLPPVSLRTVGWQEDFGRWKVAACNYNGAKQAEVHQMLKKVGSVKSRRRRKQAVTPRDVTRRKRTVSFNEFVKVADDLLAALPDTVIQTIIDDPNKRNLVVDIPVKPGAVPRDQQIRYAALVDDLLGQLPEEIVQKFLAGPEKHIYLQVMDALLPREA